LTILQRVLDSAQLGVDLAEPVQLGRDQLVAPTAEAMQVEHETAEVAIGELTHGAQVPQAAAQPTARAKAGLRARRIGPGNGWLVGRGRLVRAGRLA
jgi:hypothetical protein